jgi:hypothetical protein
MGGLVFTDDEYDTEFDCKPDRSDGPLSLDEFIRFIDAISCQDLSGPFSLAYNELNADVGDDSEVGPGGHLGRPRPSSPIPGLEGCPGARSAFGGFSIPAKRSPF